VDAGGGNAAPCKAGGLILHQGDERRYHDRRSGQKESWDLVAERFAAAGGKDPEDVAAVEERVDELPLTGAEGRIAEAAAENGKGRIHETPFSKVKGKENGKCGKTPRESFIIGGRNAPVNS
jgi:hypothetical protein